MNDISNPTFTIAVTNEPNVNGHTYKKEAVIEAMERYMRKPATFGALYSAPGPIPLDKVSHELQAIEWDDNVLKGTIKILKTSEGELLKQLISGGVSLTLGISCMGVIKEGGIVEDLTIMSVNAIRKEETNH